VKDKSGSGSVSRSFNFLKKYNTLEFRIKSNKRSKLNNMKRKKKINNRCKDCNKLISVNAIRCNKCSIKYIKKRELNMELNNVY